jgi:hypothetical protein
LPDIFSYELVRAFGLPGCALCRAVEADDERWMDSFWREGRRDPEARKRFFEAGGFCRDHAWLLHRLVAAGSSGAAIADLYGHLATYDLRWLEDILAGLERRRTPRRPLLRRRGQCPACVFGAEAVERKAHFLVDALSEAQVGEAYRGSGGLCFPHLASALDAALAAGKTDTARFLLEDWRDRLDQTRGDARLIRQYVGDGPSAGS